MLHPLRFSLQNAIYFIMLPFLVPLLFTFYVQGVQNLNVKLRCQKVTITKITIHNPGYVTNTQILLCPVTLWSSDSLFIYIR